MESLRIVAMLLLTAPQIPKQGQEHRSTLALNRLHKNEGWNNKSKQILAFNSMWNYWTFAGVDH